MVPAPLAYFLIILLLVVALSLKLWWLANPEQAQRVSGRVIRFLFKVKPA